LRLAASLRGKRNRIVVCVTGQRPRVEHELFTHHEQQSLQQLDTRLNVTAFDRGDPRLRRARAERERTLGEPVALTGAVDELGGGRDIGSYITVAASRYVWPAVSRPASRTS
jgi:hypothetical protein